ncbi:MAG: TerB family tellurite resistance protein [Deltaproteobacteria bacterium]|nr:TerB family tellurite resistance protein [Deltaproteobacteria bacterium]MCZ6452375.1 TerB family tellurite resistance protein [Deltaproteobacteria bacterium]
MALPMQVEFLKVLACVAWADEEVTNAELNFIKQFVRRFDLSGDEWMQVELYLSERVDAEEMKQVTRRFFSRVHRSKERRMLVDAVENLLRADESLTDTEQEWLRDLQEVVSGAKKTVFFLDGLKSLLRIGGENQKGTDEGRDADLHDFIHNRVLFKLRRRLGSERLEECGTPAKLKKLTLSAALLGRVGYVDNEFLPQEEAFMKKVLSETWGASPPVAEVITEIAIETVRHGVDLHRLVKEVKETMSKPEKKNLLEGIFALAMAEGRMSNEEVEEIRKIAYMLDFSHKQFIDAKLKILKP